MGTRALVEVGAPASARPAKRRRTESGGDDPPSPAARLEAYVRARNEPVAATLRAFRVRSYLWPRLTAEERARGAVVDDGRVAGATAREVADCLGAWFETRDAEAAFRRVLGGASRVAVVHGALDAGSRRALAALAALAAPVFERPPPPPPERRVRDAPLAAGAVAAAARAGAAAIAERGVWSGRVLDGRWAAAAARDAAAVLSPTEVAFYPGWRSSDFFLSSPAEPPVPLSAPLLAVLGGAVAAVEAVASAAFAEALVVVQANATRYAASSNASLGAHYDGCPAAVVVSVGINHGERRPA